MCANEWFLISWIVFQAPTVNIPLDKVDLGFETTGKLVKLILNITPKRMKAVN